MAQPGYKQFCPVAMAAEVLCTRWTMVLLRELLAGSTRFNDLRRGVPKMSPSLLAQRLRDLEQAGIVARRPLKREKGLFEYKLTDAGEELRPLIVSMGTWGQRWVESQLSPRNLDPSLLMWDMRRNLNPAPLPNQRVVVQFLYRDLPKSKRDWWLVVEPDGEVDLCWSEPGFEIDLHVSSDLKTMTAIWMGLQTIKESGDAVNIDGNKALRNTMQTWLGLSPFATETRRVS